MRGFFCFKKSTRAYWSIQYGTYCSRIVTYWQTYLTATIFSRIGRIETYFLKTPIRRTFWRKFAVFNSPDNAQPLNVQHSEKSKVYWTLLTLAPPPVYQGVHVKCTQGYVMCTQGYVMCTHAMLCNVRCTYGYVLGELRGMLDILRVIC